MPQDYAARFGAELTRDIDRMLEEIPRVHRDLQAELVGLSIDDLVLRSPVLTGAYRSAHFVGVGTGDGEAQKLVYDSPEHADPAVDYKPGGQPIFQVPDGKLAEAAYQAEAPFQRAVITNDRRYASDLEYGNALIAPRSIYATAEAVAEAASRELADRKVVIR